MMKAKKVFSVLLAAALLYLAVLCVQAEEEKQELLRDKVPAEARTAGIFMDYLAGEPHVKHTYKVYQLLKGEVFMDGETPVLGAYERGSSLQEGDDFQKMLLKTQDLMDPESEDYCESEIDLIRELNALWYAGADRTPYAEMTNEELLDVEPGYYLIVDTKKDLPEDLPEQSFSAYIFGEALGKTPETGLLAVEPKATATSLKKEVRDNNKNDWGDHADLSFSSKGGGDGTPYLDGLEKLVDLEEVLKEEDLHLDVVAFRLTATLGENFDLYDSYKLIFHDELPGQVDYLKIDNKDEECLFRVEVVDKDNNPKFETFNCLNDEKIKDFSFKPVKGTKEIQFASEDVKQAFQDENGDPVKLEPGDQVRVTYYAYTNNTSFPMGDDKTLSQEDKTAVTNSAVLEYSNNPMSDQMGKTEPEEAKLYTYNVMIIKTNKGGDPLTGARFALKKKDDSPGAAPNTWINMSGLAESGDHMINETYGQLELGKEVYTDGSDPDATNMWFWKQIDAGDYELVETLAPDGYDKLEKPIRFKVEGGLKDGKWAADISIPQMEENEAVTECKKEKVYAFVYIPSIYVPEDEQEIYLIYLPESSPIYQNTPGANNRYFPQDLPEDFGGGPNLNLKDLVAAAKEGRFCFEDESLVALDNKGGVWQVADPDDQYIDDFECEAFTITIRNFRPDEKEDEGISLPVTGGIGTTAFYVVGGIMTVGAAVVLITRKRVKKD